MTEKRYQLRQEQLDYPIVNFCCDLVDTANNDKVICSFDNDIGTSKLVDLLNEQDEYLNILCEKLELANKQNIKLKQENKELEKDLNDALNRIEERSIDVQLLKEENGNLKKENELKGDFRNFINEDIVRIKKENEQLKQTIKGVYEILSIEVDVFSDKATEHDINAYVELKELDNKDAYYIAQGTKKAIELLKKVM